jgi:hypothetical protein
VRKKRRGCGNAETADEKLAQFWNISASQWGDLSPGGHAFVPRKQTGLEAVPKAGVRVEKPWENRS